MTSAAEQQQQQRPHQPHYGRGFVYRPVKSYYNNNTNTSIDLRSLSFMQTSGQARAGSGCFISHEYQFVYIHVLKSGGMTLKQFLRLGLCSTPTSTTTSTTNKKSGSVCSSQLLQVVDCRLALEEHAENYFIWSFVRNPYDRMYSAFAMALAYRGGGGGGNGKNKNKKKPLKREFDFATFVLAHSNNESLSRYGSDKTTTTTTANGTRQRPTRQRLLCDHCHCHYYRNSKSENPLFYDAQQQQQLQQQKRKRKRKLRHCNNNHHHRILRRRDATLTVQAKSTTITDLHGRCAYATTNVLFVR